jgi:formylglycine-generating enzyme required for sulfatase activity
MSGGLAEIRGYLVKGESEEGWLGMCRMLEEMDEVEREMVVLYVSQHTKGWRDSLRRPLYGWWERKQRGEWTGYEGLVADWSMYAWSEGKVAGEARVVPFVEGMKVRWIPAGTFLMGEEGYNPRGFFNGPQREVTITRGFWMGETPVTQGQYQAIMARNPSHFGAAGMDLPVERVTWYNTAKFANRLSALEGASACFAETSADVMGVGNGTSDYIGCKGWRLPTEAEWEYAARAGTTTLCYGELDKIAWYKGNSGMTMHPVGQKEANAWGLYDTLGNVWEWCYDGFCGYGGSRTVVDPVVDVESMRPDDSAFLGGAVEEEIASRWNTCVQRGGECRSPASFISVTQRSSNLQQHASDNVGFRVVRSIL